MNRPLLTCWIALGFIFAAGAVAQILRSEVPWKTEGLAAWVQAVGSVVAIGVAIYISSQDGRRHRLNDMEAQAGALRAIARIGANARYAIEDSAEAIETGRNFVFAADRTKGLETARDAIDRLPLATLKIPPNAVTAMLELRSYTALVHRAIILGAAKIVVRPMADRARVVSDEIFRLSVEADDRLRRSRGPFE